MPTGTGQLQQVWGTTIKDELGTQRLSDTQTITGSNKFVENVLVPAGLTVEIDCGSIDKTKITGIVFACDQAVTVDTNALGGSGGQTIALAASKAWGWHNNMPTSCPVTVNITKIFVSNAGIKDATFKADILLNLLV